MTKPKKLYARAWKKYGKRHQLDILIEEMSELIKSILKARRYKKSYTKHIVEELADVQICTSQLEWFLNKNGLQKSLKKMKVFKLKRLKKILRSNCK